jgi:hypothetical protein
MTSTWSKVKRHSHRQGRVTVTTPCCHQFATVYNITFTTVCHIAFPPPPLGSLTDRGPDSNDVAVRSRCCCCCRYQPQPQPLTALAPSHRCPFPLAPALAAITPTAPAALAPGLALGLKAISLVLLLLLLLVVSSVISRLSPVLPGTKRMEVNHRDRSRVACVWMPGRTPLLPRRG